MKAMYEVIGNEIGKLVDEKNNQYGDAINKVGEVLKIIYPNGIFEDQYADAAVMIRVLDKLFRISHGNKGMENAWKDIAGYGVLMSDKNEKKNKSKILGGLL